MVMADLILLLTIDYLQTVLFGLKMEAFMHKPTYVEVVNMEKNGILQAQKCKS